MFFTVIVATNLAGKQVAVLNGFTYYCAAVGTSTVAWRCTRGKMCKARFVTTRDMYYVIRKQGCHDHHPPKFFIADGILYKGKKNLNEITYYE